jgi:chorismate mutase/prephenate dehydratase
MLKIAFLGQQGSFSSLVASQHFPQGFIAINCQYASELFVKLTEHKADIAIVPIENTLGSSVLEHYDLLYQWADQIQIVQEVRLAVHHCLIALPQAALDTIHTVYAHPQAFLQCSQFLQRFPHWQLVDAPNTTTAMELVLNSGQKGQAFIGSEWLAKQHSLSILASNIENYTNNLTRFFLVRRRTLDIPTQANKCSLCFKLKHQPKSLLSALQIISQDYINLTKIESRPILGSVFEYIFYIDFEFPNNQLAKVKTIIQALDNHVLELKNFGFYEKSD